jgi:hypothetical protein
MGGIKCLLCAALFFIHYESIMQEDRS